MKILHLCLGCFYVDGYSYQENMLPKYHKEMGHNVEIIASTLSFDENGKGCNIEANIYINEYGIKVIRLPYSKWFGNHMGKILRVYDGTYNAIKKFSPDIIFVHGCQFLDIKSIVKYAKKHQVKIYVDNHADFSNSATNWISKKILHGIIWKYCAHSIEPYTKKFYGVLPVRVDFLNNVYKLPKNKCELLVMGADDSLVELATNENNKKQIRNKYNIADDEFLIVTGGKIDQWKKQTFLLMEAVKELKNDKIRLLVFGSVVEELKKQMEKLVDGNKIQYIGWIKSQYAYEVLASADLAIFPGRHSVMWEQVVALGIPMIVKRWDGTTHIDVGGNVLFLDSDSKNEIAEKIEYLLSNPKKYEEMKKCAIEKGRDEFSYRTISRKAIEE